MARVRKYAAEMPLNEAVELAITECINEGILTEFLQHNRAEVYKVSIFEYDKAKRYDRFMATHSGTDQPVNAQGILHPIQKFNDNYYLIAREGDTFKTLGKEVEISWRKLARYNERDKHTVLHKGDIIYLKKKRKKAPKQYKKRPHIVQPGESMYTISQRYGIRIKYLYKMNKLDPSYQVKVGDRLRVR